MEKENKDLGRSGADAPSGSQASPAAPDGSAPSVSIPNAVLQEIHTAMAAEMNRAAGVEGWQMRDIPRLTFSLWDELLDRIGRDHVKVMVQSTGNFRISGLKSLPTEPWVRGTILISPEGMARLASGIAARSDETPQAAQPEGQEPVPKGDAQGEQP